MYATRTVTFDSTSVVLTIEGGNPIWLHSIVVANNSGSNAAQAFTWNTGGGALAINPTIAVIARDTAIWHGADVQVHSLALSAAPASGVVVTITYRVDG